MIYFRRLSAREKAIGLSAIVAVAAGIIMYWASTAAMAEWSGLTLGREIQQLRSLKTLDVSQLAELLDRSVVQIPSGDFIMGSNSGRDDESPQHLVYLDAFGIDRYEVTNIQYQRFLLASKRTAPQYWRGNGYPLGQEDYPVVGVRWDDADAYCKWAGKRLPTEAEWEKACRGTDGRIYPWGDTWDPHRANVDVSPGTLNPTASDTLWDAAWEILRATPTGPGVPGLQPVGSHLEGVSPYGVMDMVGSASEWVADWYNWSDYSHMPARNPIGLGPPWNHCVRGSAWHDPAGNATWVQNMSRCSARNSSHADVDPRVGFRCARSLSGSAP
jgi:formylglycine-generating enzyme required for sulfatase activity